MTTKHSVLNFWKGLVISVAKNGVSAQDMAAKLMGSGAVSTSVPKKKAETQGTKRLNLDISIPQWRKLKGIAMDRDMTVSDLVREWINRL